jgi:RNA-dependent RNA polymerase
MAQQEINTEFEVWSTFVLSRPRVGTDYKMQEEMARFSDDLKNRFRAVCIESAGSKDFAVLGPFIAGMYRVTKEELDIALAECRSTKLVGGREVPKRKMEPKYMPLISFPWLFEKELARIATGIEAGDDLDAQGLQPIALRSDGTRHKSRGAAGDLDLDDFIQQEDGVIVHRGEVLDLFRPDIDSDSEDLYGDSDLEEAHNQRSITRGDSGEVVLATSFQPHLIPSHLISGTGVEDLVPQVKLDGLTDPRENARVAHASGMLNSLHLHASTYEAPSVDDEASLASSELLDIVDKSRSLPANDPAPQNQNRAESISSAHEELEEEVVDLDVEQTSLEKLVEMMAR